MSMKDLLNKMSQIESLPAPKARQVLNESSPAPVAITTSKRSLKDVFNELHEAIPAGTRPIPVVGKQGDTQQTGAGFLNVTDTSPAAQALGNAFSDLVGQKKVQIVMPTQGQTQPGQSQPTAAGQPNPNQMQTSNQPNQTMQEEEFDEANTGDKAEEKFNKYNAKELDYMLDRASFKSKPGDAHKQNRARQAKDAAYNLMLRKKYPYVAQPSDENLEEGAKVDRMVKHIEKSEKKSGKSKDEAENIAWATANKRGMLDNKNKKKVKEADIPSTQGIDTMGAGLGRGRSKTTLEAKTKPDFLDLDKDGNKKEPMKKAAADKKKKAVNEAAGDTTNIGYELLDIAEEIKELARNAMRLVSGTEEEGRANSYWYPQIIMAVSEDHSYLGKNMFTMMDSAQRLIDGSGDEELDDTFYTTTSESKKTKKKKAVKENMNNRIQAARLEGKAHGLKGHAHNGKHYEDMEEGRAYHEGYKEGLDECYGMGPIVGLNREARMPVSTRAMARNSLNTPIDEMVDEADSSGGYQVVPSKGNYMGDKYDVVDSNGRIVMMGQSKAEAEASARFKNAGRPPIRHEMADDMDEGNAFTGALARTPKGGKFSVGGKSFTDRSSYDSKLGEGDFAFEAWDRKLNSLVKEGGLNEVFGMSNKEKLAKFAEKVKQSLQGSNVVFDGLKLQSRFSDEHMRKGFTITGEVKWDGGPMVSMTATAPGESSQFAQFNEKNLSGLLAWISKASKLQEGFSLREGFSVSISKGESNSPDSVNVNATDAEADKLLSLVKQAGLGIFGGEDGSDYGSPEVGGRSEINSPGGIEVVDDHDGMLGLMKKLSGIDGPNADYEEEEDCGCDDEEENVSEARCDECGMMESKCGGHDEALDEVQSPDQLEFGVAEANSPDSGAANATNDTQGNAAANQALAKADADQDIEDGMQDQSVQEEKDDDSWIWMDREEAEHSDEPAYARKERKIKAYYDNLEAELGPKALRSVKDEEPEEKENDVKESFTDLYKKLAMLSEESTAEKDEKAEKAGKKVTKDIEYDDKKDKKEKVDEWANQVGKGPGKGTDASFEQDIDFMTKVISGGLNKPKSTGQTTVPVVASQLNRLTSHDTTSINENIESHIKSLRGGRNADDGGEYPEIDNHPLYDALTAKVSQMEDEEDGARYQTLIGEANDLALKIAADTGFSAFSIVRYCSSHKSFNRWFYREKPAAFWSESVSEMKRLAGLNEDDVIG